ncbi:MAG: hypothetical protein FIO02_12460 [Nitrosopumilales archaeon]|nr:hypothetical protein [Nitrosopumilales archaeon]
MLFLPLDNKHLQVLTSNQQPVTIWNHVVSINIKGVKMYKSFASTPRIRDIIKKYNPNILRL